MRALEFAALGLLLAHQPKNQSIPVRSAEMAVFTDSAHGVTFRYPRDWKPVSESGTGFEGLLTQARLSSIFDVETTSMYLNGEVPSYGGLDFVYGAYPAGSQLDCDQFLQKENARALRQYIVINGIAYLHVTDFDAGMSKSLKTEAYLTYQSGFCHIFEIDDFGGMMNENEFDAKIAREDSKKHPGRMIQPMLHSIRFLLPAKPGSK